MGSIYSEFLKLKRSMSWAVVVLLPVIMVFAGAMSTFAGEGEFADGWHTLWPRSIGFYGMAILPVGIAILASLVWRVEHKNGNWNALMSRPVSTVQVVIGKVAAISLLAAAMQLVFVTVVIALGKLAFGLPGMLPAQYWLSSAVVIVACIPVAALQSALSTFFRSFAAPVAIALVVTGVSTMALLVGIKAVSSVLPYAVLTQATQLGTILVSGEGTSFDVYAITPDSVLFFVLVSAALTVAIVAGTSAILNRLDIRA
ncbi:ABC transporter [Rubrobacter tropicus]|uniref:ABC transporter n=1 Tax=Rubrobacter tropicus TaxID=2653851 RepID=A0A6G8QDR4_9ACTN|nr:ABC transporter permease [Rubrobacter tropicus]QIN84578.1 ABC transporter [Rubrobacter tropicus]